MLSKIRFIQFENDWGDATEKANKWLNSCENDQECIFEILESFVGPSGTITIRYEVSKNE
jgi:hypothetical protein